MKVILIDDEAFFRVSFKSLINWKELGCELVGEATDGEEALKLIEAVRPDLVFLDITMPKMNGLEVLERLGKRLDNMSVIVLSSYSDYEYVRSALKSGAYDYIHKPLIDSDVIIDLINKAGKHLESKREAEAYAREIEESVSKNELTIREASLRRMLSGRSPWEEVLKIKPINLACLVVQIEDFSIVTNRYENKNRHVLLNSMENIIREICEFSNETEYAYMENGQAIVLISQSSTRSMESAMKNFNTLATRIREAMKVFLDVDVTIGKSKIQSTSNLTDVFNDAHSALSKRYFNGPGIYESSEPIEVNGVKEELLNQIDALCRKVSDDRISDITSDIEGLIESSKGERAQNHKIVMEGLKGIFYTMRKSFYAIKDTSPHELLEFITIEELINADTFEKAIKVLEKGFALLSEIRNKSIGQTGEVLNSNVQTALIYIREHYNESISLESISRLIGLNKSYFARLFKQSTGESFTKFLNGYRIDKAKKILSDADCRIYEIADQVGFRNVEYFNQAFRTYTGLSPSEFREKRNRAVT